VGISFFKHRSSFCFFETIRDNNGLKILATYIKKKAGYKVVLTDTFFLRNLKVLFNL